jgi:hypothetical protein
MSIITDVFAFSVQNADYWTDLLSGGDYPSELTEDEIRALEAARAHIEAIVVELLHTAGVKLSERLGVTRLAKPRFKAAVTARKRLVALAPPTGLTAQMYRIEFGLHQSENGTEIVLYPSLVVKKGALDTLRTSLAALSVEHSVDDYYVYARGIPLPEGASVDALAAEAAKQAARLLDGFSPSATPQGTHAA